MKLRATVLGYLLMVLLACAVAEAGFIVDAPHNSDNNIMCGHCHSADALGNDFWFYPPPVYGQEGYNPDVTRYNWVCERCHSAAPTDPDPTHKGPVKQLHAASTIDPTNPTPWSTECIDCHDPHFQRQLEWEGTDGDDVYLSRGLFDTRTVAQGGIQDPPVQYNSADIYSATNPTNLGGPKGTTRVGVTITNYQLDDLNPIDPPYTALAPNSNWTRKGKSNPAYNANATDHSRGLILVADISLPMESRIFEIVKIEQDIGDRFKMWVNGDLSSYIAHGQEFGVIYGGLLRTRIKTPPLTEGEPKVLRDVKFFTPKNVLDADGFGTPGVGGPIDLTVGATAPVGLCQACHTNTVFFKGTEDAESTGHYETTGKQCAECHDMVDGGAPAVDHAGEVPGSTAIIDEGLPPLGCSACHVGYSASPDGGHQTNQTNNCQTCHLFDEANPTVYPYPDLNATALGMVPWASNTGTGATHSSYWPIACDVCHVGYTASHAAVPLTTAHNGRLLTTTPLCTTFCHGGGAIANSQDVVQVIHNPSAGTEGDCNLCHLSIGPPPIPVELNALAGPGSALNAPGGAFCTTCHTTYFNGHNHGGNHDATVIGTTGLTDTTNCVGCHDAVAGGDAPDAITSPYITVGEVHADKGCDTCHALTTGALDGQRKDPGFGRGDATVADGGDGKWECVECHGAFAVAHVTPAATNRATTHPGVSFSLTTDKTKGGSPCNTCHQDYPPNDTTSLNSWAGILREHSATDTCDICHDFFTHGNTTGAANTPPLQTVRDAIKSNTVTCATCHTAKAGAAAIDHGGHLPTDWSGNAACNDCHATSQVEFDAVVDKIHNDNCDLCHVNPTGSDYTRKLATDGNSLLMTGRVGDCLVCHPGATFSRQFIHHDTVNADTTTLNNGCTTACHNNTTGHQGVHTATVVNAAPCSSCHTTTANTGGDGNVLVDSGAGAMVHDYCTSCHRREVAGDVRLMLDTVSTLVTAMPEGTTPIAGGTDGGGVCTNCHGDYFGTNTTGHTHSHVMTRTASCATANCHDANGGANARKTSAAPFVGSGDVHETISCVGCHNVATNGGPVGSAVNWNGGAWGGAGSCTNCHNSGVFGTTHAGINAANLNTYHLPVVNTTSSTCTQCHDLNPGTNITARNAENSPYVGATETHQSIGCAGCHNNDGTVKTGYGKATGMTAAGGNCEACHGAFFANHTYHDSAPAATNVSQILNTDISGTLDKECSDCHHDASGPGVDGSGTPLDTWAEIKMEHDRDGPKDGVGACVTCHQGSGIIRSSAIESPYSNVLDVVTNASSVHCLNCHYDKIAPNVHLPYDDHMVPFANGYQIYTFAPIVNVLACTTACHPIDLVDAGADDETDTLDVVLGLHGGACATCHRSQPWLLLSPNLDQFREDNGQNGNPNGTGVACTECHQTDNDTGFTKPFHGMTAAAAATPHNHLLGSTGSGPTDCESCHAAGTAETRIALHPTCETCHTEATTPATTAITSGIANGDVNCETCHTYVPVKYRTHALTAADAGTDGLHNKIGTDAACTSCHVMTNEQQKLELHTVGCLQCHNAADFDATWQADQVIFNGRSLGGNLAQNCVSCHDATAGSYLMHGLDNIGAAAVHSLNGSDLTQGINCELCHAAGSVETRLGLHASCAMCHSAGTPASTKIAALLPVSCEGCHTGVGIHTMHEMSESLMDEAGIHENIGTDAACTGCHIMTTQEQKLWLHTNPKQGHNGSCMTCHKPSLEGLADAPALTFVNSGKSVLAGGSNTPLNCVSCHDGSYLTHGLANTDAAHPNLINPNYPTDSTTTCSSGGGMGCHAITTVVNKLALHPTCATCHSSADAAVILSISDGFAATPVVDATAPCEECHGPTAGAPLVNISDSWYNHNDPDHAVAYPVLTDSVGATAVTDCESCHDSGSTLTQVEIHDTVGTAADPNACAECHAATSALQGSATAYTDATTAECIDCHDGVDPYFDLHATRSSSHGTAMNTNIDPLIGDRAQTTEQLCSDCHYDSLGSHGGLGSGLALDTWAEIIFEHQSVAGVGTGLNACEVCHLSTRNTDIDPAIGTTVADVIAAGSGAQCLDCHFLKKSPYAHGGHADTQFAWTAASKTTCGTVACHDWDGPSGTSVNNDVVNEIHNGTWAAGYGNVCQNCHTTSGGGDATYLPNVLPVPVSAPHARANDAGLATQSETTASRTTVDCEACHTGSDGGFDGHLHHGIAIANQTKYDAATDRSQELNDPLKACAECHNDVTSNNLNFGTLGAPIWDNIRFEHDVRDGSKDASGGCNTCHDYATDTSVGDATPLLATVQSVIATGGLTICTTCHVPKLWSNPSSTHGGHDGTHFMWDGPTTASCGAVQCHDAGGNTDVVATVHNGTCDNCHSASPQTAGNEKLGSATNGIDGDARLADGNVGTWDATCTTCHPIGTYDLSTVHHTSAEWTANGLCTNCHVQGVSQPISGNHAAAVSLPANCADCHGGTEGTAGFILPVASGDNKVHDTCETCHNIDPNGTLKTLIQADMHDTPDWVSAMPAGGAGTGDAVNTCESCHTLGFGIYHGTVDHAAVVSLLSPECNSCHTGTEAPAAGGPVPLGSGNDKLHDTCMVCHTSAGLLTGSAATHDNSTNGGLDGGGDCGICHTSTYFDSHSQRVLGSSGHQIVYTPATDKNNVGTSCGTGGCHNDNAGSLATWDDILIEHDIIGGNDGVGACAICHSYSSGTTPPIADHTAVITSGAASQCIDCHTPKPLSAHGGHSSSNFVWSASCGTADCHDSAVNTDIVNGVHDTQTLDSIAYTMPLAGAVSSGKPCMNCHPTDSGGTGNVIGDKNFQTGDGSTATGFVGQAVNTSGSSHTETCEDCHGTNIPRIHHYRNPAAAAPVAARTGEAVSWASRVTSGNCYICHNDNNYTGASAFEPLGDTPTIRLHGSSNATGSRPGVTPCAMCHIVNDATNFKIKKYNLAALYADGSAATSSPVIDTGTFTHVIPNWGTPIAIQNSGNCLHCHGSKVNRPANYPLTGSPPNYTAALRSEGRAVKPRHAYLPIMVELDEKKTANQPRMRMALHPGHINYRLMATVAQTAGAGDNPGIGNPMNNRNGAWNNTLYADAPYDKANNGSIDSANGSPKDLATGNASNIANWNSTWNGTNGTINCGGKLKVTCEGNDFLPAPGYPYVPVTSVPYTINDNDGPWDVPTNP